MIALFQKLDTIKTMLVAEVIELVKLILVMPVTNAVSERLFSSPKKIKTYFHSTITNNRLNHFLILHIHKLLTDRLDLTKVSGEFVEKKVGKEIQTLIMYCTVFGCN